MIAARRPRHVIAPVVRRSPAARALSLARSPAAKALPVIVALAAGACSGGDAAEHTDPAQSVTATQSPAPLASSAPEPTAAPAPQPPPPPDRPSKKAVRPPGVERARWQKIFDVYGHLLDIDFLLDDYHRRYPAMTEVVTLATTHEGRAVRALLIADKPAEARTRPAMLLNGAHHGDEPFSSVVVLDAATTLLERADSDPKIRRYLSELAIWCVPLVNPDGFAAFLTDFGAGRKNGRETRKHAIPGTIKARGVDLNRNYPFRWGALKESGSRSDPLARSYRGPEPKSEPEARALVELSDSEHFVGSISFHVGTVALLVPYTIDGVISPLPNEAWRVAEEIAKKMPPQHDRALTVRRNLYSVDGTDQDYHRFAHGTLALLFEAASRSWESQAQVSRALDAVRPSWSALFDRYLDGPSVQGHVRDAAGRPISAEVRVVEVVTRSGEAWKSRPSDGFFGRYLPGFGRYTIRVVPASGAPLEEAIEVTAEKGRATLDFVVNAPPAADKAATDR